MSDSELQPIDPGAAQSHDLEPGRGSAVEISACWSRIGVYGDASCEELEKVVHCRNCPVYSSTGLELLNRPLPEDYRQAWTAHFAQEKKAAAPGNTSAILFRVGAEWLALPTQALQEVAEPRAVHSLPHRRLGVVLGLTNVRGELLVCVSLGHLLGLEGLASRERLRTAHSRLLVASWDEARLAFPVEEVHGTHRFQPEELLAPPATVAKSASSYTQGILYWREQAVGFLDPKALFTALNRSLT